MDYTPLSDKEEKIAEAIVDAAYSIHKTLNYVSYSRQRISDRPFRESLTPVSANNGTNVPFLMTTFVNFLQQNVKNLLY